MRVATIFSVIALTATVAAAESPATARDTRLIDAVKTGNGSAALSLIQQKRVDVNGTEPDGTTALHYAVRNDDAALVDRLLRAGAGAKAANRYGITPIYLACENGSEAVVARLLKAGVDANSTGPMGETALHTCARTGKPAAAKALLASGAAVNPGEAWRGQTPLMWAAAEGHAAMIRLLVEAGADLNARSTVVTWERQRSEEPRDKWLPPGGLTALLLAAREGRTEAVKTLVELGADVNEIDPDRHNALIIALINGHFDVAGALIDKGIDVNATDKVGRTALWAAVDAHTMPTSGKPMYRETDDTLTSLQVIEVLLAKGADVNAPLRQQIPYRAKLDRGGDGVLGTGTTPLLRAAKAADAPVIKLLLEKGADPKAATRNGVNAIMMAANVAAREEDMTGRNKTQADIVESVKLLLAAGTDLQGADNNGRTALHGAATWGLTDVVKFLVASGGKLDTPDKRGLTALDAAMGLTGGFGFDGRSGIVREDTAKAIRELGGKPGTPQTGPTPSTRQDLGEV
jgi:ankyrin repeat protein